jgi:hypothetical protein
VNRLTLLLSCALVVGGAIALSAQEVLYTLTSRNEQAEGRFGQSVSWAGDVNNDGYEDIVVGARREALAPSPYGAGRAYVFSGDGGGLLYTFVSPNEQLFGWFGCSVSGVGDVDNDGYDDVVVGAPFENPGASPEHAGRAYVFSGRTADTLYTLVSPNEEERGYFGWVASGAGDVNNDGYEDIVVGASLFDPWLTPPGGEGRAYIFGGRTGAPLYTLVSPNDTTGYFGNAVSGVGDVDGDGSEDVVVGAWYDEGENVDAGRAYVFSGQTGDLLYALTSPNDEAEGRFGAVVSETGDVDGDGCSDLIVGSLEDPGTSPEEAGRAYVFSGATGTLLHTLASPYQETGGWFTVVSSAGDVDQDGSTQGRPRASPGRRREGISLQRSDGRYAVHPAFSQRGT